MSKELTVFVVDLDAEQLYLDYFYDIITAKLLKGRATDLIAVVACHSNETNNDLANEGKFSNIDVIVSKLAPTYESLKRCHQKLVKRDHHPGDSDMFLALIVALDILNSTKTNKFIRNLVVFPSGKSETHESHEVSKIATLLKLLDVKLLVINPQKSSLWEELSELMPNSSILLSSEAADCIKNHPPLRKVRPMAGYKGQLNFGAKYPSDNFIPDAYISFKVEVYPMVKSESFQNAHLYVFDGKPVKLNRETENYIFEHTENDDQEEHSMKTVNKSEWVSGFKYSNYDLIATPPNLIDLATLKTSPTMDIVGFLKYESLPFAYLTNESYYVVPMNADTTANTIGFTGMCKALIATKCVAIVRFVKSANKEVQMAALLPMEVARHNKTILMFSLIRLPFKEDEKVGRFPRLTDITTTKGEQVGKDDSDSLLKLPSKDVNDAMEKFINAKTLDEGSNRKVKNPKICMEMVDSVQLPLPEHHISDRLCASSPAINKFSRYLKKTIYESLQHEDIDEFLTDPNFIKKFLVDEHLTSSEQASNNFLTLSNVLEGNSDAPENWLKEFNSNANVYAKEIIKDLDIRYVDRNEYNKSKKQKLDQGGTHFNRGYFGAGEDEYGELPDIDL